MQDLLMEARSQTDDWRYWHVGELLWGFFMVLCHLNPQEHVRLWHDERAKLAGYAVLGEDPSFDWQILPRYEWSGIEVQMDRVCVSTGTANGAATRLYESVGFKL
jgi:hypothetical protein